MKDRPNSLLCKGALRRPGRTALSHSGCKSDDRHENGCAGAGCHINPVYRHSTRLRPVELCISADRFAGVTEGGFGGRLLPSSVRGIGNTLLCFCNLPARSVR